MEYTISGANIVALAVAVWFIGTFITKKVALLERYSIPVAVTGGLLCSLVITAIYYGFDITINFDTRLRDLLLLTFFSTIGLSAKISLLKEGGKALVILLLAAAALLILQDTTGVILAMAFGVHPGYGLFGGSVSLAGGHGTAIAWGGVAEQAGLQAAKEIGIAFATFGLIAGGLIGGPIAERLIAKHGLQDAGKLDAEGAMTGSSEQDQPRLLPPLSSALGTLMLLAVCVEAGDLVNQFLFSQGVTLPGFLTAMVVGIIIANTANIFKVTIDPVARERASELSLELFLAMSLMSMQLWVLAGAVGKILIVLFAQMTVITLFAVWIVFRVMGRNYDAAVIVAGFAGLGMGATPVGIANMNAVTSKYGPSPKAFLVIPLVGAFFPDIVNALVITTFLAMPFMQMGGS
jgi:ESS family glutamate:Na+ symporter